MLNERNTLLEDDGIEEEILVEEECSVAQAVWGDIQGNIENQTDLQNALDAKQDSLTESQLNAVNSGITAEKVTAYDGYADQIASKADQSALSAEATTREQADTALGRRIDDEATARQNADNGLQSQIDAITSQSDVVDVVANYAALQAYDTSSLSDNDVIKVLDDETHEDALTYYRWSTTTQTWSYIGQEAPYYSKGQMDVMLQRKQDTLTAGANIQIENGTISATDTTYTAGNGLNLNDGEFSADTDVLATKEDLESYYTKPETDNLLAPKLEAEVVAELPTTGEEGKLYLTPKAHTTQTATGNPITATVAEDAGALESFQLDGDTFQQSYEGKNLFDFDSWRGASTTIAGVTWTPNADQSVTSEGTSTSTPSGCFFEFRESGDNEDTKLEAGTYYIKAISSNPNIGVYGLYRESGSTTTMALFSPTASGSTASFTIPDNVQYQRLRFRIVAMGSGLDCSGTTRVILSKDQSFVNAGIFEPFVGGIPSPNPDYPQPIQTVTGLQTISINGTDYPLDLGNIELNGLGDDGNGNPLYKDRIYRDGEDWKVHKATDRLIFDGSSYSWSPHATIPGGFVLSYNSRSPLYGLLAVGSPSYKSECSHFLFNRDSVTWTGDGKCGFNAQGAFWCINSDVTTLNDFLAWMEENNPELVYPLATPTDTVITDQTLIAQLEAIRTASLQNGTNTITNTATGSNLAGDMEIGYYGFAPRNRYDKWLWLDINNEYEQIGS